MDKTDSRPPNTSIKAPTLLECSTVGPYPYRLGNCPLATEDSVSSLAHSLFELSQLIPFSTYLFNIMNPVSLPISLLSLPYNVRKRIYFFAGLIRDCPITIIPSSHLISRQSLPSEDSGGPILCAYQFRKLRQAFRAGGMDGTECICPDLPKQLLLVCKSLQTEAQELLYGENKFVIRAHRQAEDLEVFGKLPTAGIRIMRHLLVRLNSWPCIRGHNWHNSNFDKCMVCPSGSYPTHGSSSDPEISHGDSLSENIIYQWLMICQRLSNEAVPGALHLEIICDVQDLTTAQRIIKPLESLPHLRGCSIRLGRKMDFNLRSLARLTSLRLTNGIDKDRTSSTFSFSSLPREIRLRVLWFTNLGPGGSFTSEMDQICIKRGKFNSENGGYYSGATAMRACCLDCSFTKVHCSCLNFAAYSPSCSCRVLPLELFLTNRQMCLDATEVFFSTNIFRFQGSFSDSQHMFQAVSPRSLKQIRQIVLDLNHTTPMHRIEQISQWRSLISFINKHFNTSRLCVEVDLVGDFENYLQDYNIERNMQFIYDGYIALIHIVKEELYGLLDFHIILGVSFDLEPVLEKYIMGSQYDSRNGNRYPKTFNSVEYNAPPDDFFCKIPPWHREL